MAQKLYLVDRLCSEQQEDDQMSKFLLSNSLKYSLFSGLMFLMLYYGS